ncbi:MAG: DUF4160 domain-containing protein [Cytophagales bacterium]
MPKLFEYFGFIFMFYSNEHKPIHVHIQYNEFESIAQFMLKDGKIIGFKFKNAKGKYPIPESKLVEVEKFLEAYKQEIVNLWIEYFELGRKPKCIKITKKL